MKFVEVNTYYYKDGYKKVDNVTFINPDSIFMITSSPKEFGKYYKVYLKQWPTDPITIDQESLDKLNGETICLFYF